MLFLSSHILSFPDQWDVLSKPPLGAYYFLIFFIERTIFPHLLQTNEGPSVIVPSLGATDIVEPEGRH